MKVFKVRINWVKMCIFFFILFFLIVFVFEILKIKDVVFWFLKLRII